MGVMDRYNEKKKKKDEESTGGKSASGGVAERYERNQYYQTLDTDSVDEKYINSFISDTNTFFKGVNEKSISYDAGKSTLGELSTRYDTIQGWLYKNKSNINKENYNKLSSTFDGLKSNFDDLKDFYSKWENEDAYNQAVEEAKASEKARAELLSFDLEAGQKEIDELEALLKEYDRLILTYDPTDLNAEANVRLRELRSQYTKKELKAMLSEKKSRFNQAKHLQETTKMASVNDLDAENYDPEFEKYSGYSSMFGKYDQDYETVNYKQSGYNVSLRNAYAAASGDTDEQKWINTLLRMNDEEVSIYNYYYAKYGKDEANKYLDSIVETINRREAEEMFKSLEDNTALELVFGFAAGLDQFESGVKNFLNTEDDYIPSSAIQMASGMVREDLSDDSIPVWYNFKTGQWENKILDNSLGQVGYDAITTTANMLPSIIASTAVGILNPTAGQVVGSGLMGMSAAGNAYQEMLNLGYDKGQARWYSTLVGASEAVLQYILGGIGKLGGVSSSKILSKVAAIDKSFLRISAKLGVKIGSEIAEEELQNFLEPAFRSIIFGEDYDAPTIDELLETAIVTALSTGALESPGTIGNDVANSRYYKNTYGNVQRDLVDQSLELPDGSLSKDLGQKYQQRLDVGKDLNGHQLGRLVDANEQFFRAEARLTELGETGDVGAIAAALAKRFSNQKLTRKESQLIANSQYGRRVSTEMNPENIQTGDYSSEWAEKIDTNRINVEEYSRLVEAAQLPQETAAATGDQIVPEKQNAAQPVQTAAVETPAANDQQMTGKLTGKEAMESEDGVTRQKSTGKEIIPQKIVSIKGGKVMIQTDNGTIAADDIQFGTKETDLLWRSAADFHGINTAGANGIIRAYKSDQPVATYLNGAAQEFRNGYHNLSSGGEYADKLTSFQREIIYALGQKAAGENIAMEQAKKTKAKKSAASVSKTEKVGKVHFDRNGRTFDQKRETALKTMEQLSKALGVEFYVFESYVNKAGQRVYMDANGNEVHAPNGWYDPSDGSIHIDLNAGADGKGTMLFTIAHELTHFIREWSPAKFKVLANFLIKLYGENDVSVKILVEEQIKKAKKNGRTIDYDTAFEEVVADSMEAIMADGNVVQFMAELKQQDKALWQKICDWFKDLVNDLKSIVAAYKGVKPDSNEGKLVADMKEMIVVLESLYADALVEAGDNYQAAKAQKNTTREGDVKLSIKNTSKMPLEDQLKLYYKGSLKTSDSLYFGVTPGTLSASGLKDLPLAFPVSYFKKSTQSKHNVPRRAIKAISTNLEKAMFSFGKDGRIGFVVPDIDGDGKQLLIAIEADVMMDREPVNVIRSIYGLDNPQNWLQNQIEQGKNFVMYNEKEANSFLQTYGYSASVGEGIRLLSGSIYDEDGVVKKKFSLRDTVEETKDLVAVHNLSEKKLLKSLQLGGLPMPSIAILRAQDGHSEFGDISLVFGRDTIDPQAYRTNKLYSGDAWTPTYPNVEYKPNSKVLKQIEKKISELVPSEVREFGRLELDIDNLTDTLNRYGGDVVDAFKDNDALKYAYLKEAGADIQLPMKEKNISYHGSRENGAIIKVAEAIPADVIQNALNSGSDEIRKLEPVVRKAVTEYVQETYGDDQFILDTFVPAEGLSFSDLDGYLVEASKYLRTGIEKTVDTRPAREMIRDMTVQYSFEEWLSNLFSGIVEKEGIRNNADYYTPSGNRRSFEALHYEHNLENVIKAMREKGEKGIGAFGGGSIFGAAATEFSSIKEMKQAGERLQKITEEEYQKMRDAFSERFFELASSLPNNKNSFTATDDAANMLVEAVSRYSTKSGMANYIRRESQGWATYSDYVVDDLMELVRDIRNMPTGYFEAKPRRAVGFDEVFTAIVPNTVSGDLRAKMVDMGIPFVEYKAGDEEARKRALNSLEGVKFSDRDSDGNELSQEQQDYFKDSKVRDKDGNLLVMYHGTKNFDFTVFDRTKAGKRTGFANFGKGNYFTVFENGASYYGSRVIPAYLKIANPIITSAKTGAFANDVAEALGIKATEIFSQTVSERIKDAGFDGVIVYGIGEDEGNIVICVTYDSSQIKEVSNKNPTSDPDIRYSERDPELDKVNQVLEKENAQLKHDVAYLKELLKLQNQVTGGTKFTKTSVEAAARQLMKYSDAKGDTKEFAGLLNAMYEYIAGSKELTWDGVVETAQPAVAWLQNHVRTRTERSAYAKDVLNEIRNSRIYLDETQKKEVAYQYGSYNEFRKKTMGSVILTDHANMSLDSQWHAWAEQYPDLFDPDMSSTDMPSALLEVFDSLRNMTETNGYGYERELFGQELLSQVYNSYWNVSTLYTVKDKAQKEINKLKFDHAGRMAKLKQYHKEQAAKLKQEHREDLQRIRQEMRDREEAKLKKLQDQYHESRKKMSENRQKAEMRRKIRRTVMDLKKILNKGDKKRNVKEDMKDLVTQALRSADILFTDHYSNEDMVRYGVGTDMTEQETKYMTEAQSILAEIEATTTAQERQGAETRLQGKLDYRMGKLKDVFVREKARLNKATVAEVLGSLADAYMSLENSDQDYVKVAFDENVYQYLTTLKGDVGGTTVKDMSLSQLEELHKAYTMVLTTVRNANKMFAENLKQTREQLGSQTINEVKQSGGERKFRSKAEKAANAFAWNNQKPVYAFEWIGSETLKTLFDNTRAGEDRWALDMTEAREFYLEQVRKFKYDSWDFRKQYKFTSSSGTDFALNLEQIMSLYAYSKRKQAHDHLLKGGFVFDEATEVIVEKTRGIKQTMLLEDSTAYNVSMEILAEIVSKLNDEQKAFVDQMQDFLSTTMGEKGNEVSMQLYGVKLFNEKFYFPLRSAGQYMERAKEADLKKQQGQISIVNSGFAKSTTPKSSNPVVLSGFMDVWADHVNEMSMYHSFVLPMEDFRRVYNYSSPSMESQAPVSVNSTIRNAYGKAATDYIDQLYRDLNGGAVADPRENGIKSLVGKFKKAAVFTSLSVVVQQPSAIGRAFAIIDPKYFIGSKVDHKRHKALWAELKQYAPVAAIKEMGYFDTGMGKSAQDFITGKEYHGLKEKAAALFTDGDYRDEVLSKAPALADELTWCAIWDAAKRETKAKNPKMDVKSEEFLQLAGKRFTEVITKTQVYDSVLSRSANMRSKGVFMSMWTAFMAEPTTTINMVEDALRKAKNGDKKYAARAMGAAMTSIVLNSLLSSLVYAMRDDDEDETFLEKYMQSFATEIMDGINPITYYPFLKDVWSALQGFDIERSDMSLITSLTEKITKLVQIYAKDSESRDEGVLADAWWGVVDYATALVGIPVKNVRRDINGAINTYKTISKDLTDRDTSWGSLIDQTWDEVKNSLPVVGWFPDKTAADKLYEATISGDTAYQKRLASSYKTENSLNSAIRKGLRDNDSRVWEAAMAWNNNNLEGYKRIAKEIITEGHFSQDNVVMAIRAEAKAMLPAESNSAESKAKGYFTMEKFTVAISQNNHSMAATIKADIIETAQKNGKSEVDAVESFASSAKSNMKEMFMDGKLSEDKAVNALLTYCDEDQKNAQNIVAKWQFESDYGFSYNDRADAYKSGEISSNELKTVLIDIGGKTADEANYQIKVYDWENQGYEDVTTAEVKKYYEKVRSSGVSVSVYYKYCQGRKGYSKKDDIMAVIHSLPITVAQKDALYYAEGWAQSKISEAPWH